MLRFLSTTALRSSLRKSLCFALLGAFALFILVVLSAPGKTVLAAGVYSGTVFRDYNADGTKQTLEPGVGGVVVTLYNSANTASGTATTFGYVCAGSNSPAGLGCTAAGTPALGSYSITSSNTGPYRVEFTLPSSGLAFMQPGASPSAVDTSQSTVQFVANGGATVNLGLNDPSQYVSTTNPRMFTNAYIWGPNTNATGSTQTAMYSWDYTLNSTTVASATNQGTSESTHGQIGSTWGLAYRRTDGRVYASAYLKRLAGFGPGTGAVGNDGSGSIYYVTPNQGGADNGTLYVDVDTALGGNQTGNNLHNAVFTCGGTQSCDADAFTNVGKASFGDLEISADETKMWVVNLFNKHLVEVQFTSPNPTVVDRGEIPSPTCTNGTKRPFGLGWKDGLLYVGGICDESTSGSTTATANLTAWVYTFNPSTNAFSASPVINFPLNYNRTCLNRDTYSGALPNCNAGSGLAASISAPRALWHPWTDTIGNIITNNITYHTGDRTGGYTQPILSDIVFDNQDMILGFRDRTGDMLGYNDPGPNSDNPLTGDPDLRTLPGGDILRANPSTYAADGFTVTGWTIEQSTQSNPTGIFGPTGPVQLNRQGPGDAANTTWGEFFYQDTGPKGATGSGGSEGHQETSLGGLAQVPGFTEVALTAYSPRNASTIGQLQLFNTGATVGATSRSVQLVGNNNNGDSGLDQIGQNFSKTNGLGDIEALMDPAPVEIGNRIWRDTNSNGRQDAGESGISGVVVGLYNSAGVLIESVTTDTNGNYLFSSATGTDVTGKNYNMTIPTGAQYTVAVYATNFNTGQPLVGLQRTFSNFDGQSNNAAFTDIRDSDAIVLTTVGTGTNAATIGVRLVATVIAGAGYNNHSVDFGFTNTPTAVDMGGVTVAANSDSTVGVHWESYSELNIVGFNILRAPKKDGPFVPINNSLLLAESVGGLTGNSYDFTDPTVQAGKRYFYSVELVRPDGSSERTAAVKVKLAASGCVAAPDKVTGLTPADRVNIKKGKVVFGWNPAACATRYKWQLRLDSAQGQVVASNKDLTAPTTSIKKLQAGKTYAWRVASCNAADQCTQGTWQRFTVTDK